MFYHDTSLKEFHAPNWNTKKLISMELMFSNCKSLKKLEISNWNIERCFRFYNMLENCMSLEELDISKWNKNKYVFYMSIIYGLKKDCKIISNQDSSLENDKTNNQLEKSLEENDENKKEREAYLKNNSKNAYYEELANYFANILKD